MNTMIESRRRHRGQGGFTLIELLVVVAILGILAGVAVFAVGSLTDDADTNACKIERDTLRTAAAAADATGDPLTDFYDGTPKYFSVDATGISGTIPAHPGGDCPTS